MKKIYILIALTNLSFIQSCDKFLDLKPQDIQVVSKVEDYRDLLASYMRLLKTTDGSQKPVLGSTFLYPKFHVAAEFAYKTGEALQLIKIQPVIYDANLGEYNNSGVKIMTWMESDYDLWDRFYSFLGPINMIIDGITAAEGNDENLRNYVKGEALVWRAYSYFKLIQYYSPYKEDDYGIPVFLKPYDDPGNACHNEKNRVTYTDKYLPTVKRLIDLIAETPSNQWNCAYEPRFIYGMLASIYCYKAMSAAAEENDWQQAITYADKAIAGRSFVRDQSVYDCMIRYPSPTDIQK